MAADRNRTAFEPDDSTIQEVLERRARLLSEVAAQETVRDEVVDLLVFRHGQEHYGIPLEMVEEVSPLDMRTCSAIPCTPPFVHGAVNIRGHVYSILNIASYFGQPHGTSLVNAHLLLVVGGQTEGGDPMELCLLADEIPAARTLDKGAIKPPAGTISGRVLPFVRGVTTDMMIVLDLDRLLSDPGIIVNEEP